jgi:hypothetical protein
MIPQQFIYLSIVCSAIGGYSYIRDTLRGKTKPNRVSFFLWSVAPLIGVAAALRAGVGWPVLPIFLAGFTPLVIFFASFANKNAYWKLTRFDYICGLFSLIALVFYFTSQSPVFTIAFSIIADLFVGIPTIVKSWKNPESESPFLYFISNIGNLIGLLIITNWTFAAYGFGIYLILMNSSILLGIYQKKLGLRTT